METLVCPEIREMLVLLVSPERMELLECPE